MRVAFIHPFLFRYARGIERFTLNLSNALERRGIDVHLLTWRWCNPVRIDVLAADIQVHSFPTSRYFAARLIVPFYVWDLLAQEYDFVWIFFAGYGEAEALAVTHKKFGIVFHYPYEQTPHRYREFRRFRLIERASAIVSVSQYVANGVRGFCGRESFVVHHGVDSKRFSADAQTGAQVRASLNLLPDSPVIVSAAALEERKGIQWALRALPLIIREYPEIHYLVLGEGEYQRALEQIARELQVENRVHFLGAQQNVERFYQAADVMLVLARGEASSLSALEALACGVPVIAARHRPFSELIEPSYGLLVDEENPRDVALAVSRLLGDSLRLHEMAEAGRARMITDFTWDAAAKKYLEVMSA